MNFVEFRGDLGLLFEDDFGNFAVERLAGCLGPAVSQLTLALLHALVFQCTHANVAREDHLGRGTASDHRSVRTRKRKGANVVAEFS